MTSRAGVSAPAARTASSKQLGRVRDPPAPPRRVTSYVGDRDRVSFVPPATAAAEARERAGPRGLEVVGLRADRAPMNPQSGRQVVTGLGCRSFFR